MKTLASTSPVCSLRRSLRVSLCMLVFTVGVGGSTAIAIQPAASTANSSIVLAQVGDYFLQEGDQGADVQELQWALHQHGVFERADIDGYYGPLTVNAVKKYQANRGLRQTGVADFETLNALSISDLATARAALVYPEYGELSTDLLGPNHQGVDVRVLQLVLRNVYRHDDTVALNGIYDDATRQAVRVFQRARNITVTGVADRETLLEMGFLDAATVASQPTGGSQPAGGPESRARYYTVIVAGRNQLPTIRQTYSDAFVLPTVRGEVISIGAFDSLQSAQQRAAGAEDRGFSVQVIEGSETY